jgi:hypothetical protein
MIRLMLISCAFVVISRASSQSHDGSKSNVAPNTTLAVTHPGIDSMELRPVLLGIGFGLC